MADAIEGVKSVMKTLIQEMSEAGIIDLTGISAHLLVTGGVEVQT